MGVRVNIYQIVFLESSLELFHYSCISYSLIFLEDLFGHFYHNHATKELSRGRYQNKFKKQQRSFPLLLNWYLISESL